MKIRTTSEDVDDSCEVDAEDWEYARTTLTVKVEKQYSKNKIANFLFKIAAKLEHLREWCETTRNDYAEKYKKKH